MGMIKLLAAPVRSIVRFPLFQLAVVVAVIFFCKPAMTSRRAARCSMDWMNLLNLPWDCFQRYSM